MFPNASQMASSIGATNSRGIREPFTPAGAVCNWSLRAPEPKGKCRDTTEPGESPMSLLPRRTKWRDPVPPCPKAGALQYWTEPPRCRLHRILDDGYRHQCHKSSGHNVDSHACPCGRDWK